MMEMLGNILLFGMPGGPEWLIIILFVIIFFGAKKIPDIARGLGQGMREFRKATDEIKKEFDESTKEVKKDIKDISDTVKKDLND